MDGLCTAAICIFQRKTQHCRLLLMQVVGKWMVWVGGGMAVTTCCGLVGEGGSGYSLVAHTQPKAGFDIWEFVKGSVVTGVVCNFASLRWVRCCWRLVIRLWNFVIVPEIGMYNKTFRGPAGCDDEGPTFRVWPVSLPPPSTFPQFGSLHRGQPVSSSACPLGLNPSAFLQTAPRNNKNSVHIVHIPQPDEAASQSKATKG
jgi:hypothetical protein